MESCQFVEANRDDLEKWERELINSIFVNDSNEESVDMACRVLTDVVIIFTRHNGKVERVHRMDSERFYNDRKFYSVEDANKQLQSYQRWDNNFPLLVLGRKSPLQYWRELSA